VNGTILVAGATGKVGSAAVRHLPHAGFEVRALARSVDKGRPLRALDAEVVIGDVTKPSSLAPAVAECKGVYSALAAGHGSASEVEYRGNLNLLSAAEEDGVSRFVYSSALLVDHLLAQRVSTFGEKWRFEEVLLRAKSVAPYRLTPGGVHGDPAHGAKRFVRLHLRPSTMPYLLDIGLRRRARRHACLREGHHRPPRASWSGPGDL